MKTYGYSYAAPGATKWVEVDEEKAREIYYKLHKGQNFERFSFGGCSVAFYVGNDRGVLTSNLGGIEITKGNQ